MAEQFLDDPLDHLHDVELALAQVGIVELFKLMDQISPSAAPGPFGIAAPFADDLARLVDQFRVFEEHGVDVDEGGELGWRVLGRFLHRHQFALDSLDRRVETGNFLVDHARRNGEVRHLERRVRHEHGPPDGDAAGDGQTMQREAHGGLLAFAEIVGNQGQQAVIASCLIGAVGFERDLRTLAGRQHHHAHDALGVDAARPLAIQTSHLYLPASCVSLAEARACRPSLLMISVSLVSMVSDPAC
jgi:hypothetical protein